MTVTIAPSRLDVGSALEAVEKIGADLGQPKLTAPQREFVVNTLTPLIRNELKGFMTLEGAAGCGKTVTLVSLILAACELDLSVAIVAPTHKASSVLRKKLDKFRGRYDNLPQPGTIHSLLKLKPAKVLPGKPETFRQVGTPRLGHYDLILIDECSMVGSELLKFIIGASKTFSIPVVFCGDPHQLAPVNERGKSQTFDAPVKYQLTEVLRHDGAVLNLATRIRTLQFVPQIGPDEGGGSRICTYTDSTQLEEQWLNKLASIDSMENPNEVIMLSWKNVNRRAFNDRARKRLFGPDVPRFMSGDVVVTMSAFERDGECLYNNNQDLTIEKAEFIEALKPIDSLDLTFASWLLTITDSNVIPVLDDAEIGRFKSSVRLLGSSIKAEHDALMQRVKELKYDRPDDRMAIGSARHAAETAHSKWSTQYYALKSFFADVDFRYALTVHKSQGSEYGDVFIHDDYLENSRECVQLLYVAATRAEKAVHHLHTRRE
jgi:exodeoxyribonuclease-5